MNGIQVLSKEEWQGYELVFRYETTHFYDAEIKQDSNRLRVTSIWVAEKYRRKGFGKNLLTLAKSKALELGCRALMLETQSCNDKAIAFYLSQGLTLFGFDRSCYSNSDIEKHEVRLELGMYLETPAE